MLIPIEQFCQEQLEKDPSITAAEMLHNLHMAGYDREASVREVLHFFPALTVDEMCRIIVNEYTGPLITKEELRGLLLICGYDEPSVEQAIERYYPKSLGYVLMLDDSCSMYQASAMIKIDAKAFLDCSRRGDQFGVSRFETSASWLYPDGSAPEPAVVTEGRDELEKAAAAIDTLKTEGSSTNIGEAVSLANDMEGKMKTDIKAFVLISDGEHNHGPNPAQVLKNEPPIYIAGLGPYMRESYFHDMLAKNVKSKYYNAPNAFDMMRIFNQILADSSESLLGLNQLDTYQGANYRLYEFIVSAQGNYSMITVVWSDKKYWYTSGYPGDCQINLVLIGPDNKPTDIRPQICGGGFCIYNLKNVRPGTWRLLAQYSTDAPMTATVGVIREGEDICVKVNGPQRAELGATPEYAVTVSGGTVIENLAVTAVHSRPVENMFSESGAKAVSCSRELVTLQEDISGAFKGVLAPAENSGIYTAHITVKGQYPDGLPFICHKMHTVIVG